MEEKKSKVEKTENDLDAERAAAETEKKKKKRGWFPFLGYSRAVRGPTERR